MNYMLKTQRERSLDMWHILNIWIISNINWGAPKRDKDEQTKKLACAIKTKIQGIHFQSLSQPIQLAINLENTKILISTKF